MDDKIITQAKAIANREPVQEFAVRGAMIKCNFGTGFDVINLPLCHGVYSGENPLLNIRDMMVGQNIFEFGMCLDGKSECKCKEYISISESWMNPDETKLKIEGSEALLTGAQTTCTSKGGIITITHSGQNAQYIKAAAAQSEAIKEKAKVKAALEADAVPSGGLMPKAVAPSMANSSVVGALRPDMSAGVSEVTNVTVNDIISDHDSIGQGEIDWPEGSENWTWNEQLKYIENKRFDKSVVVNPEGISDDSESEIDWPEGYENWTWNDQLKYIENKRFDESVVANLEGISGDVESEIDWPEGYENWTWNEQLKYCENKKFDDSLGDYYKGFRDVGSFVNLTLNIANSDVAIEIVYYDSKTMSKENFYTVWQGEKVKIEPDYAKPFVYIVGGLSASVDNEMLENISKQLSKPQRWNAAVANGGIKGKEYIDGMEASEYFDDPGDYNGKFISNSLQVSYIAITVARDPNKISKTVMTGLSNSKSYSLGYGESNYQLIPQKISDYLIPKMFSNPYLD